MTFSWPKANDDERRLLNAIQILVGDDPTLLKFLLDVEKPRLKRRSGILRDEAWRFSDEEQLMIRAALDLWSGSGHLQLWEMLEAWEPEHWLRFIRAIRVCLELSDEATE
jgi:hypothetical protein